MLLSWIFKKPLIKYQKQDYCKKLSAYGIKGKVLSCYQRGSTRVCVGTYSVFYLCKRHPINNKLLTNVKSCTLTESEFRIYNEN